jgi:hypothetical protein
MGIYLNGISYNGTRLIDKAYYYAYDEPQNTVEYGLAGLNCWMSKKAMPGLRVAVYIIFIFRTSIHYHYHLHHHYYHHHHHLHYHLNCWMSKKAMPGLRVAL